MTRYISIAGRVDPFCKRSKMASRNGLCIR